MSRSNREETENALKKFERICKPKWTQSITTQLLDKYISVRKQQRGKKKGSTVSPATVNKELRHLKAVFGIAVDWKYLDSVPRIRFLREPEKLVMFVTADHFGAIYGACNIATRPVIQGVAPVDWWQAILTFTYMTGWRISEVLQLRKVDVDIAARTAITRHADNKGGRDDRIRLHPIIVEHIQRLNHLSPNVFQWPHRERLLWPQLHAIQEHAGIHLECREEHEHGPECHLYGFHDFRRGFASENAENLSASELQAMMRHRTYATTQRYINIARQTQETDEKLFVPDALKRIE